MNNNFKTKAQLIEELDQIRERVAELERVEEALRKSEDRYRTVVEDMPALICRFLPNGILSFVNNAYCQYFGKKYEELIEHNFFQFIPAEDREKVRKHYSSISKEKPAITYEHQVIALDGTIRWQRWTDRGLFDESGALVEYQSIGEDITERKQAEEALRGSEERYRTIFENVSDSITYVNKYGTIISANNKEEIFGRTPEEIVGKKFTKLGYFDAKEIPKYLRLLKDIITGRQTLNQIELEIKHKDGHKLPVEMSTSLVKRDGKTVGFVCITRDITERKWAEEAIKASEERYRSLVESTDDAVYLIGRDLRYEFANRKYLSRLGLSLADLIGQEYVKLHPSDTSEELAKKIDQVIKSGEPMVYEHLSHRDNKYFLRTLSPVAGEKPGEIRAITVTSKDITERKRAEAELEATHEQLRNLSAHLQSVREEDQAMLAREIHDELGQALTTLKFGIVEIKNALPADQISLVKKATSMAEYIDTIAQTVNRIATRLRPALLDELGLVEAIEWEVEQFEDRTGIKCELTVEPEEMVIDQDRSTATYRIVQEALTNIARHAQATRSAVTLKMSGGKLHLSITDNGIGIAEDQVSAPKSLGIIGMRERVLSVGGNFEINRIKKGGTKIMVIITVENES